MKVYCGSGGIAPCILDLATRWKWVVCFTPRSLYPRGKSPWFTLDRSLGGPRDHSGRYGVEKNSQPLPGLKAPIIQDVAQRFTTELYCNIVTNLMIVNVTVTWIKFTYFSLSWTGFRSIRITDILFNCKDTGLHVMDGSRILKAALNCIPRGQRNLRRPREMWIDRWTGANSSAICMKCKRLKGVVSSHNDLPIWFDSI
jgi:hypothetical protein